MGYDKKPTIIFILVGRYEEGEEYVPSSNVESEVAMKK